MTPVTRGQKIYFAAVGLFALWVGIWGYFIPGHVDWALPWLVPPLHARFLGAVYLSAAVLLAGGVLARNYVEVRVMILLITIWTGMLFILSLVHFAEFDFSHRPVWFWFGAYLVYPLIGLWYLWRNRSLNEKAAGSALTASFRGYLQVQGAVFTLLALCLLLVPGLMVAVWPWKITLLLAQIYSAPFLAYGVCSLLLSRQQAWLEVRLVVIGTFVLAFGALLASFIHRGLFSVTAPATWIWFGVFLTVIIALGWLSARSLGKEPSL